MCASTCVLSSLNLQSGSELRAHGCLYIANGESPESAGLWPAEAATAADEPHCPSQNHMLQGQGRWQMPLSRLCICTAKSQNQLTIDEGNKAAWMAWALGPAVSVH